MPINVVWKTEAKMVLVFAFEGRWDVNDFFCATEQGNVLLDEVTHSVDMLLDVQNSRSLPSDFMNAIRNVTRKAHPNTGIMVMVGINTFARAFISLYRKAYPRKAGEKTIYYASNYDEVQAIIDRLGVVKDNLQVPH